MIPALLTGVALGVAGSAHCIAMCSPLVSVVAPRGRRAVLHHSGRGAVYVLLGLAAGLANAAADAAGLGRWWALLLAIVLLVQAASSVLTISWRDGPGRIARALGASSAAIRAWAVRHPGTGALGLGAINGLLPCGLVYGATVAAAGMGGLSGAVSLMVGFTIGTTPALSVGSLAFDWTRRRMPVVNHVTPALLVVLAALLIARALSAPDAATHAH